MKKSTAQKERTIAAGVIRLKGANGATFEELSIALEGSQHTGQTIVGLCIPGKTPPEGAYNYAVIDGRVFTPNAAFEYFVNQISTDMLLEILEERS